MKDNTVDYALRDTLCWHCSRATDSTCSWSERLIPVDGWTAEYTNERRTYTVTECPLFTKYDCSDRDDSGYRKVSNAVLARAGQDYLKLMKHEKRLRDNDVALATKRAVYGNWYKRNKEPIKYQKATGDTLKALYGFEPFNREIIAIERFFVSEYAELFGESINPIYIMESIQRQVGIKHESL